MWPLVVLGYYRVAGLGLGGDRVRGFGHTLSTLWRRLSDRAADLAAWLMLGAGSGGDLGLGLRLKLCLGLGLAGWGWR
jgi:hypothetical protein